ncbi:MAG: GPR endopeptidase [Clostridiales bacterium]|nr:GPR endopeptidase [Candidatus Cacconaster stercorequi]
MKAIRTDLALEMAENLGYGQKNFAPEGIHAAEKTREGYTVTDIRVESSSAAQQLGKPVGRYITIDLRPYFRRQTGFFVRGVRCLAQELTDLLPGVGQEFSTLVAGLGNPALTADAVGPLTLHNLLVTRHMVTLLPLQFSTFSPVAALECGVTGCTGLETLELLQGVVEKIRPAAVITVDALAAQSRERLCATIQLGNTGLIPGSGVGNHRAAINQDTLGVPVIAVGLPTVISTTVLGDKGGDEVFVTPRDIDQRVRELSRLIGYGITAALQPALTLEDISGLLG